MLLAFLSAPALRGELVQIHAKCRPNLSADERPLEALLAKHGRVVRRQRAREAPSPLVSC